jgi:transposase
MDAQTNVTIGLDVGDRYTNVAVVDEAGELIEESRIRTTPAAVRRRFEAEAPARVALEAGTHSPWMSRLLERAGHDVLVANARRLRFIYDSDNKRDPTDAEALARVARLDPKLLKPIRHRSETAQQHLAVVRARDVVVGVRTALINHARGAVKAVGSRLPRCSAHSFVSKVARHVPPQLVPALAPVLESIGELTARIRAYDREIEQLCAEHYPETERLRQVAGVGPLTALAYVLVLEDPTRFPRSRAVGPYLGLRPKLADSGQARPQLRISKGGDELLRKLLVQSAHYVVGPFGPDTDLRRWGLRLAARGGKNAKKRAVIAVARKLAVLLHRLWISGAEYEPLRHERVEASA